MADRGTLYGVSVGPGDPELITLRAVKTLAACPVVAAPRTAGGRSLALDIAAGAADLSDKTILYLDFTMARREEDRRAAHERAADALAEVLLWGQDAAFLTLGDVSVYSTFDYVEPILRARGFETCRVPGVPSFCAAAARLGCSLADGAEPIHILPAGSGGWEMMLEQPGTKILMKPGELSALRAKLETSGKLNRASMVQNCGLSEERVLRDMTGPLEDGYYSVVIVKE